MTAPNHDAASVLEPGSIWSGGGMTVRVIELWPEDARVERLTKRGGGLLKRPGQKGVIPLHNFTNGRMRRLQGSTIWSKAILERYGR